MNAYIIRITVDGYTRHVRQERQQAVHTDIEQKWTEHPTLWSPQIETSIGAVDTVKENARGPIAEVSPYPFQEASLNAKIHQLVQDDVSVGHIERTLEVNEGHHAAGGEAGVELGEAVVRAPARQKAKETRREVRLQSVK